jgi:hypothetical protein
VNWAPYKDGDPIPERPYFWVTIRIQPPYAESSYAYVDRAERAERKGERFFYVGSLGRCSHLVTHYAPLDWPEPA